MNKTKNIYYIETTTNGYIVKKIKICEWNKNEEYIDKLIFNRDDEEIDYYNDVAGNFDDLDLFLRNGNNTECEEHSDIKSNIYLEYWLTDVLGYYQNIYIGLMIA